MSYITQHRKSPRAEWHDYNGANYFITICTKHHNMYFGEVVNGQIDLSEIGEWARQCIEKIETINDNVFVPEFVVMPNHVHLIVIMGNAPECLDDHDDTYVGLSYHGSHYHDSHYHGSHYHDSNDEKNPEINKEMQRRANLTGRLSHVIGQYKSAVTKYANKHKIQFMWQPRFHDHIIRNINEMNRIANYIQNNPIKWEWDRFYKNNDIL